MMTSNAKNREKGNMPTVHLQMEWPWIIGGFFIFSDHLLKHLSIPAATFQSDYSEEFDIFNEDLLRDIQVQESKYCIGSLCYPSIWTQNTIVNRPEIRSSDCTAMLISSKIHTIQSYSINHPGHFAIVWFVHFFHSVLTCESRKFLVRAH